MSQFANIVHETTTGTGTGTLTLTNVAGWRSFNGAFGNGATEDVFRYCIRHVSEAEYEIGTGHMSDATTLVRDSVIESSNSNAAVDFSAGTKYVLNDADAAWLDLVEVGAAASGTVLPTGGNLVTGQVFHLTAADDTAKAPPGLYVHDGTGWLCLGCLAAYAFGNLGATPSLSMIAGAAYTMVVDQEITSATVALSRPGIPVIFRAANADGDAVAVPTMTARTTKTVGIDAITGALSTGTIWDDGTYLWITCGAAE